MISFVVCFIEYDKNLEINEENPIYLIIIVFSKGIWSSVQGCWEDMENF